MSIEVKFCPKCGSRLVIKTNEEGKREYVCPRKGCGYREPLSTFTYKILEERKTEAIRLLDEKSTSIKTMPIIRVECPKCGNMEAYWWIAQTRGMDESPTRFYRCTRCGHTWREYS